MPYPNEMAARITEPGKYKEFRRFKPDGFPAGVEAILGIKEGGGSEIQAIRVKKEAMTFAEFKKWLSDNDFKPISVEDATERVSKSNVELFSTWAEISLVKGREVEQSV